MLLSESFFFSSCVMLRVPPYLCPLLVWGGEMDHTKYIFSKSYDQNLSGGCVGCVRGLYGEHLGGSWVVSGLDVFDQNLPWGCRIPDGGCRGDYTIHSLTFNLDIFQYLERNLTSWKKSPWVKLIQKYDQLQSWKEVGSFHYFWPLWLNLVSTSWILNVVSTEEINKLQKVRISNSFI